MENNSTKNTVSFPKGDQVGQRQSGESAGKGSTERPSGGLASQTSRGDNSSTNVTSVGAKQPALSVPTSSAPSPPSSTGDQALDFVQVAKDALNSTVKAVVTQASDLTANVADELSATASTQKDRGADVMRGFAKAMSSAAEELKAQSPQVARGIRGAARSVDTLSENLRTQSIANLFKEASDFARRQPTGFFAGAVVAGFALSRFLKSHKPSGGNEAAVGQLSSGSGGPSPNRSGASISGGKSTDRAPAMGAERPISARSGATANRPDDRPPGLGNGAQAAVPGSWSTERNPGSSAASQGSTANGPSRPGATPKPNRPTGFKG